MVTEIPAGARTRERAHVVAPDGELDVSTAQAVREQLAARPEACEVVVRDLRRLTSEGVQRPFALARMEQRLPFVDDLEHTLATR